MDKLDLCHRNAAVSQAKYHTDWFGCITKVLLISRVSERCHILLNPKANKMESSLPYLAVVWIKGALLHPEVSYLW